MDTPLTPKLTPRRRRKFINPSPATSYKSPLLNQPVKKVEFDPSKASDEEMKQEINELHKKNENVKQRIKDLENQGHIETSLQWYIEKLHEYNDIKDIAQNVMGRLAVRESKTIREVHEDFEMTDDD